MARIKINFDELKEVESILKELSKALRECTKSLNRTTKDIEKHEGKAIDALKSNQALIEKKLPDNEEVINDTVDFITLFINEMTSHLHPTRGYNVSR